MKTKFIETGLEGVIVKNAENTVTGEKRLHVFSDYNPDFVKEARKLNGRFLGGSKAWSFDYRDKDRVLQVLRDIYGDDGTTKAPAVDVFVYLDKIGYGQSLFMFGRQLLHTWGRDSRVNYGTGVTVTEGGVSSGGSRKNPMLRAETGTVLLVRDVPENLLEKEPREAWEFVNAKPKENTVLDFDHPEETPAMDTDLLAIEFEMAAAALELLDFNAADDMPPVQEDETLEEINETGSFSVKHKASGKEIMVAWKMFIGIHLQHIAFMAFGGKRVAFVVKNDRKCIDVGLPDAKLKSELESFFGYKISAGQHIYITIDDDGMEKYEKLAEAFEQAKSGFLNKYARLAAQQPTYYEMIYSVDWGDYSTTIERGIALMRKALPIDRNIDKPVVTYYLSNNTIGDKSDEWDADWKAVTKGDESLTRVVIDNDMARKWIIIHNELQAAKEEKDQQIKAEKDKKAAEEAKRRADIFEQAKTTGKPVQLYSHFVSGNSVPKKYRDDEDNDMGNIVVYAMPDGTTTEKFFPAY